MDSLNGGSASILYLEKLTGMVATVDGLKLVIEIFFGLEWILFTRAMIIFEVWRCYCSSLWSVGKIFVFTSVALILLNIFSVEYVWGDFSGFWHIIVLCWTFLPTAANMFCLPQLLSILNGS